MRYFVSYYIDSKVYTKIIEANYDAELKEKMIDMNIPTHEVDDDLRDGYLRICLMQYGHEWAQEQFEKQSNEYYAKINKKDTALC